MGTTITQRGLRDYTVTVYLQTSDGRIHIYAYPVPIDVAWRVQKTPHYGRRFVSLARRTLRQALIRCRSAPFGLRRRGEPDLPTVRSLALDISRTN